MYSFKRAPVRSLPRFSIPSLNQISTCDQKSFPFRTRPPLPIASSWAFLRHLRPGSGISSSPSTSELPSRSDSGLDSSEIEGFRSGFSKANWCWKSCSALWFEVQHSKKKPYPKCIVNNISLLVFLAYEGTWLVFEILLDCEFGKRDRSSWRNTLQKLQVYISASFNMPV